MKRSDTADLDVFGADGARSRVPPPPPPPARVPAPTDRQSSAGRRGVLTVSLLVLLLSVVAGTVVLLRSSDDQVAAPLPPPAPPITGLTAAAQPGTAADTPGGAAGTPTSVGAPSATTPSATPSEATPSGATPSASARSASASPSPPAPTSGRAISGPLGGLRAATFELASGTSTITLRTAAIGADLYRISASAAARQEPRATVRDGTLRLTLTRTGKNGKGEVEVVLNAAVRWSLLVSASVSTGVFDLRDSELASARFAGDAARIDLRAPRPDGTLSVRVTGGINRFRVGTAGVTPARVRIRDGAGSVVLDGRTADGVAPDASFTGRGFAAATDRVDVNVQAGIGSVTVEPA